MTTNNVNMTFEEYTTSLKIALQSLNEHEYDNFYYTYTLKISDIVKIEITTDCIDSINGYYVNEFQLYYNDEKCYDYSSDSLIDCLHAYLFDDKQPKFKKLKRLVNKLYRMNEYNKDINDINDMTTLVIEEIEKHVILTDIEVSNC